MTSDIPRLLPPDQMPPVRSLAQLEHTWKALMGPLGFGAPQLWIVLLADDGRMVPGIITIEDCPCSPDPVIVDNLLSGVAEVMDTSAPSGSVAVLWARPGDGALRPDDIDWARDIARGGRRAGLDLWPMHLATDIVLRVLTPDDLAA